MSLSRMAPLLLPMIIWLLAACARPSAEGLPSTAPALTATPANVAAAARETSSPTVAATETKRAATATQPTKTAVSATRTPRASATRAPSATPSPRPSETATALPEPTATQPPAPTSTVLPPTRVPPTAPPATATALPRTATVSVAVAPASPTAPPEPTALPPSPTAPPEPTALPPSPTTVPTAVPAPPPPPPPVAPPTSSSQPVRLRIPKIGVDTLIESVGLTPAGAMGVPQGVQNVAWYNLGAKPGELGNAVLSGHLDDYKGDPAVFWRLDELQAGDEIVVIDASGTTHRFGVTRSEVYPFDQSPLNTIFGYSLTSNLNLITCEGSWDRSARNYDQRRVIYSQFLSSTPP